MAVLRAKLTKIMASMIRTWCIPDTFDSQVFKVSLRLFGGFPLFDFLVSRKQLVMERNIGKFCSRGRVFVYTWFFLNVLNIHMSYFTEKDKIHGLGS